MVIRANEDILIANVITMYSDIELFEHDMILSWKYRIIETMEAGNSRKNVTEQYINHDTLLS